MANAVMWQPASSNPANILDADSHLYGLHRFDVHPTLLPSLFQGILKWLHEDDQLEPRSLLPLHMLQQKYSLLRFIHDHRADLRCGGQRGESG